MARFLVALIAAGTLAGVAGASSSSPPAFARTVIVQLTVGSPETAWKSLHPAHQRVVPQGQFARCTLIKRGGGTYRTRVTVEGWRKIRIERREVSQHSGWSVRLGVTRQVGGIKDHVTRKLEVVRAGGRFRWLLDKRSFDAYRHASSSMFCA